MEITGGKYEAFPTDSGYNKYMMLKIRNITRDDFGFYKCIAKNSLGETDGIIKLDGEGYILSCTGTWFLETFGRDMLLVISCKDWL